MASISSCSLIQQLCQVCHQHSMQILSAEYKYHAAVQINLLEQNLSLDAQ